MLYGFDTEDPACATGALLIYAIYRSRDRRRYRVTPDMWAQIERFTKAAAKRAHRISHFVETLKPRLMCGTIHPRWMEVGIRGDISLLAVPNSAGGTDYVRYADSEQREFLTRVIEQSDQRAVIRALYTETAYCVLLVRDRLERERPIEQRHALEETIDV